ncbi:MAG TPA: tyrosine-type recombinase/integrase [Candidatus Dormibacteraeota bacterium]|nr:tyrosine-type recombinase/integrase [Candidatus Dormibacteraeota bacterium]
MKLAEAVETYLERKQSSGTKHRTAEWLLSSLSRRVGDIDLTKITQTDVVPSIEGRYAGTYTRWRKHRFIEQFFEYWVARGLLKSVPLPPKMPKCRQTFVPHIYTRQELKSLLEATELSQKAPWCSFDAQTFRSMLLFLYGTGMRLGEALGLECKQVDLKRGVITLHETKFYKSRLVPIGADVRELLRRYLLSSARRKQPHTHVFLTKKEEAVKSLAVQVSLRRALRHAGIYTASKPRDGMKCRPRIHDLRHTFAVHRLISWYRQGADVQRLLPALSTYLGHINLSSTQLYLTMTPELLEQACHRFEAYVLRGGRHDR